MLFPFPLRPFLKVFFSYFGVCLVLVAITVITHLPLVNAGLELLHSDYAPGFLVANDFRVGNWSAFYFDLPYGGTTLAPLRALWVSIWESLSLGTHPWILSHTSFSFGVLPAVMALSAFFLVRAYCSLAAALCVGLTAAFGFKAWALQYGNDVYIAYLLLGFWLFSLRAKILNPWALQKRKELFLLAVISGLAFYTSRISSIFILAFWVPWQLIPKCVVRLRKPKDLIEKIFYFFGIFFLACFIYFQIFGLDLGKWFNKTVKIHGAPNLYYGLFIFCFYGFKIYFKNLFSPQILFRKILPTALGFVVGFAPEWTHWVSRKTLPPPGMGSGILGFPASLAAFAQLPYSLRELLGGGNGIGWNLAFLLGVIGLFFLWKNAKKDPKFLSVAVSGGISILAYCLIGSYTFAPARYLLPIFPALCIGMGLAWDLFYSKKWLFYGVALTCLSVHATHQWSARKQMILQAQVNNPTSHLFEIINRFRDAQVKIVLSDDYWHSNQYSFASRLNPIFTAPHAPGLHHPEGTRLANMEKRVGILTHQNDTESIKNLHLGGITWHLEKIGIVKDRALFVGIRKD